MKLITLLLTSALLANTGNGCYENILRNDFIEDGFGKIVDWNLPRPKAKYYVLEEKGPEGMPILRLDSKSGSSVAHIGFTLTPGALYRMSVMVRTKGLTEKTNGLVSLQDLSRRKAGIVIDLPLDTNGEWQTINWEGPCPPVHKHIMYDFRIAYTGGIPKGAYIDICNPILLPCDETAAKGMSKRSTNGKYIERISPVNPEVQKINANDAKVDFYYSNKLEKMPEDYVLRASAYDITVTAEFNGKGRAVAAFGKIPEGNFILKAELVGKTSGKVLKVNEYQAKSIDIPSNPTRGKRLNNFVEELWSRPIENSKTEIILDRNRVLYIGLTSLKKGIEILVDGKVVLDSSKEGLPETMRHLEMGSHTIEVKGVKGSSSKGTITVRLVKLIGSVPVGMTLDKSVHFVDYKFGSDYFKRLNMYDGFNYMSIGEKARATDPRILELRDRLVEKYGIAVVYGMAMKAGSHPIRYYQDDYANFIKSSVPFQGGYSCTFQENKINGEMRTKYNSAEVWWKVNTPDKTLGVYIEDGGHCQFNRPEVDTPELAAYANSGSGNNVIIEEAYWASYPDENSFEMQLDFFRKQAADREALVPTALAHNVYLLNGWMKIGSWTKWNHPEMDFKPYFAKMLQLMATDSVFANVGGVSFSTPSCDDDLMRFTYDAFRYYCIEGKTGDFGKECGMKLFPGTVENGDFNDGLEGWTAIADEASSVEIRSKKGFGKISQVRNYRGAPTIKIPEDLGDRFAVISAKGDNRIKQTITNLEPGKYYQLLFASFDNSQIVSKKKIKTAKTSGISVILRGVTQYPELNQIYSKTKIGSKVAIFTNRIVFQAKSTTAEMEFINTSENSHSWGMNYVGVRPFYCKDKKEFNILRQLYIDSEQK